MGFGQLSWANDNERLIPVNRKENIINWFLFLIKFEELMGLISLAITINKIKNINKGDSIQIEKNEIINFEGEKANILNDKFVYNSSALASL